QSHQVIESTGVSGIGQNKATGTLTPYPSPTGPTGRGGSKSLGVLSSPTGRGGTPQAGVAGPSVSAIENRKSSIKGSMEAARPKVKELLEQMQSDPEARALVETFLLSQMVEEESQREEQELAALQRERQKREALEEGLEQMVAAQQELESKNRRLRAQV